MKKNFIYALMSAIAFTGAVSFSACSSSDEVIDNPDYNPETRSVKTTISLSVNPNNGGNSTRQTGTVVQQTGFRGISDILCLPLIGGDVATGTSTTGKLSWDPITAFDNSSTNYKLFANQDVSVDVDHFLFIGKSPSSASTPTQKLSEGFTTNTVTSATTVGGVTVSPVSIIDADDITTSNATTKNWKYQSDALAEYLTSIAQAEGWSASTNPSLRRMYLEFTRTGAGVTTLYNAGSAESVRLLLTDLLNKLSTVTGEDNAAVITKITDAIKTKATVSGSGTSHNVTWPEGCAFKGFPTNLGLPEGSAEYKWVPNATTPTNSKFEYITDGTLSAVATAINNFVYPNELYYLTKTPLRATSSATVNWPSSSVAWASQEWTSWTSSVQPSTKNIALKYNVNYGSARLATTIKAGAEKIYDNARQLDPEKKGVDGAKNNEIVVKSGDTENNPFTLTGILVGSQPSSVGWNFLPSSGATFNKVVYDNTMNGTINVTTEANSTPNYTLLFDDYRATLSDVNVCLEFKNNLTTSFYGKDGIILPGQTFYIVGKLNVTTGSPANPIPENSTPNTDDELDAYIPSRALRVFIQDYTTTANFVIKAGSDTGDGDGSLAKAVTTIPDLRASSQTIGLSVDLTWMPGLTFDVNLGE